MRAKESKSIEYAESKEQPEAAALFAATSGLSI
jgi:hypothetical protein